MIKDRRQTNNERDRQTDRYTHRQTDTDTEIERKNRVKVDVTNAPEKQLLLTVTTYILEAEGLARKAGLLTGGVAGTFSDNNNSFSSSDRSSLSSVTKRALRYCLYVCQ